jgi:hypothetical protein
MSIWIVAGDLILFAITVFYSAHSKWQITDIIWSLWTASFIIGYSFFFASLVGMIRHEHASAQTKDPEIAATKARLKEKLPRWFIFVFYLGIALVTILVVISNTFLGIAAAIAFAVGTAKLVQRYHVKWEELSALLRIEGSTPRFILRLISTVLYNTISFIIAFSFSHFAYAMLLDKYFPLFKVDQNGPPMEYTPYNLFLAFLQLIVFMAQRYFPFVLISALSVIDDYREAVSPKQPTWFILKPFINVIRMHIMILLLGIFEPFGLKSYSLYSLMIIYFFPWGSLYRLIKKTKFVEST